MFNSNIKKKQTDNKPSDKISTLTEELDDKGIPLDVIGGEVENGSIENADSVDRSMPTTEAEEVILPPEPELDPLVYGITGGVSYWGFSQKGESHINHGLPCQDRCVIDVIDSTPLIVAAIADGVGSCMLSHYGAAKATRAAVDFLKKELVKHRKNLNDTYVGDLLRAAMMCAYEAVHNEAEEMEQLEYSFQSTLTLAIYNGSTLFFSHAGDDGIVAILDDGTMDLATVRKKGEEVSSVLPLQSMDWETRKSTNVNAFIMATDGVLDAFVRGEKEGNRIYYPFIEPAVKAGQNSNSKVKEVAEFYYNYMASEEYRSSVTDDLTMVVITNQNKICSENLPVFDRTAWDKYSAEREAQIKAALYPADEPEPKKNGIKPSSDKFDKLTGFDIYEESSDIDGKEYRTCRNCKKRIWSMTAKYCPECGSQLVKAKDKSQHNDKYAFRDASNQTSEGEIKVPSINNARAAEYKNVSTTKRKKNESYSLRESDRQYCDDSYTAFGKKGIPIGAFLLGILAGFLILIILFLFLILC